eukprot:5550-Heterococcus_DN1.PRE.2
MQEHRKNFNFEVSGMQTSQIRCSGMYLNAGSSTAPGDTRVQQLYAISAVVTHTTYRMNASKAARLDTSHCFAHDKSAQCKDVVLGPILASITINYLPAGLSAQGCIRLWGNSATGQLLSILLLLLLIAAKAGAMKQQHTALVLNASVLARVGMLLLLPASFSELQYYGKGPHENYSDRNTSAAVDLYTSAVKDQFVNYVRPGECGAKTDVRWLQFSDPIRHVTLSCASTKPFTFSSHRLLCEDMAVRHPEDMVPRPFTAVNLDHKLMGVGGDDRYLFTRTSIQSSHTVYLMCMQQAYSSNTASVKHCEVKAVAILMHWSASVHDEYLIQPGTFIFGFAFMATQQQLQHHRTLLHPLHGTDSTESSTTANATSFSTASYLRSLLARSKTTIEQ